MGKTWVADVSSGKVATGAYKPTGNGTAHQRLAAASGISIGPHTVAGSIKPGGVISYRSESVNTKSVGSCDASGTHLARAAAPLLAKANTNLYTNLPGGGYKYNNSDGSSYTKYDACAVLACIPRSFHSPSVAVAQVRQWQVFLPQEVKRRPSGPSSPVERRRDFRVVCVDACRYVCVYCSSRSKASLIVM